MHAALLWDDLYDTPEPIRHECPNCAVPIHSPLDRCALCDGEPVGFRNRHNYTISLGDRYFEVR